MGTITPHEETVAAAETALQGAVAAFRQAAASKDSDQVALAILDVAIAHLRVSLAEQRRDGRAVATSAVDAGDVFEAAFGAVAEVARVGARWAAEYATERVGRGDPHGIGEDFEGGPITDVLDKLRVEFVRIHEASHRRSMS